MAKIAFIGLGHMGGPMAVNLLKQGHAVRGFDLSAAALERLELSGGTRATTALDACKDAEVIISMLPSGKQVEEVLNAALIQQIPAGTLFIESSTIDVETAKKITAVVENQGCFMVDAPVSGGTTGAEKGTLTFMVGGSTVAWEQAVPYLEVMGSHLFHAGPSGSGQVVKMCNNLLLAIQMIGTSEALCLGDAYGLDPKVLSEIMQRSTGRNWCLEVYNPYPGILENAPASRGYEGGFSVDLMTKDLQLATAASLHTQTAVPLGSLAQNLYRVWSKAGNGKLDFSSIINLLKSKQ